MIILFTVSEFIFTSLIKYPKMVVSGLNTLKNFSERQAAIMEDKQVMNRQTSSKELHLVSWDGKNVLQVSLTVPGCAGLIPSILY